MSIKTEAEVEANKLKKAMGNYSLRIRDLRKITKVSRLKYCSFNSKLLNFRHRVNRLRLSRTENSKSLMLKYRISKKIS